MESIGQILKAARERRQISIADLVAATKMTSAFVKAIEADDFPALVAPVYARGFIKLYAGCVGLDPMPLLKQFDAARRAVPALAPPPSKQEKSGSRSPACNPSADGRSPDSPEVGAGRKAVSKAAVVPAAPLGVEAHTLIPRLSFAWVASMLVERWSALNRLFSARIRWPRFKLPGRLRQRLPLPAIVWRRIVVVALVGLLVIAASLAWEWSNRGLPATTDACRWLAEPPAPYLSVEARPASPK